MNTPDASRAQAPLWVVCLCAEWCDVCRQYRPGFEALAREWPRARFLWLDVEDEEDVAGDVEVETFPTLLIADSRGARFLGPLPPQPGVLGRMLQGLQGDEDAGPLDVARAQALYRRIAAGRE